MTPPGRRVSRNWYDRGIKRAFDLGVLIAAHVVLLPVWALLWTVIPAAIWIEDRGPVFYSQLRVGRGGKLFRVYKFRSMIPDAERRTGTVWAEKNDPRVTRVGKVLRLTALDELPQVISILKGDMSLVGPRAERPELHERFVASIPGFALRVLVRPGLTGMAQVYGHYDSLPEEKLKFDLEYIRTASLLTDVRLIVSSVFNSLLARWDRPRGGAPPQPG